MKFRKVRNKQEETSRKSRVKMYKSGKHWVRVVMTQIGLMRLFKGLNVEEVNISLKEAEEVVSDVSMSHTILKGAAALGAIIAGGASSQTVFADDTTAVEIELSTETLVDGLQISKKPIKTDGIIGHGVVMNLLTIDHNGHF